MRYLQFRLFARDDVNLKELQKISDVLAQVLLVGIECENIRDVFAFKDIECTILSDPEPFDEKEVIERITMN